MPVSSDPSATGAAGEVAIGVIHGRFQPFHVGHLEYALQVASRCRRLVVGITNPEPASVPPERASPHRHLAEANRFTYYERLLMVQSALAAAGVEPGRTAIVPFPIHQVSNWPYYLPRASTHFIRVFSTWEAEKAARLRAAGYAVVELAVGPKLVSGSEVRRRLDDGGDWRELVPPAVAGVIQSSADRDA